MEDNKKKLKDLRVVDLRAELEKRGLDKNGVKTVLAERLQQALEEEGLDVDEFFFDVGSVLNTSTTMVTDAKSTAPDWGKTPTAEKEADSKLSANKVPASDETSPDDDKNDASSAEEKDSVDNDASAEPEKSIEEDDEKKAIDEDEEVEDEEASAEEKTEENPTQDDSKSGDVEDSAGGKTTGDAQPTPDEATNGIAAASKSTDGANDDPEEANKATTDADKKPADDAEKTASSTSRTRKQSKPAPANDQNRNLWITNISQSTRATELKHALSVHGKVIGAKVVINARFPGACCYGYVKMETVADADNCIAKLNDTELNGKIIKIEKVRPDHLNPLKKQIGDVKPAEKKSYLDKEKELKSTSPSKQGNGKVEDKEDGTAVAVKKEGKDEPNPTKRSGKSSDDKKEARRAVVKSSRSPDHATREKVKVRSSSRDKRSLSAKSANVRGRERERDMLTFDKIKNERDRERMRERERLLRDRRREEAGRQREIERQQGLESMRLSREREKLRRERDRLERERADFMQFERERQKLEREKLELERIELERAKIRMQEEERRAVKRPAPSYNRERERSFEDRAKRVPLDRHFDEAPPPPRFDAPSSLKSRDPSPPIKKFSATSTTKEYNKPRMGYDDRKPSYPPKREYEDRSHPSSMARGSGGPITKYDGSGSYSGRGGDRDVRDPRVRDAGGVSNVSSSKYPPPDSKQSRYDRERSPHFRSIRDERDRRPVPDAKSDMRPPRSDHRYPDPQKDSARYDRTASSGGWGGNTKPFPPSTAQIPQKWGGKDGWRTDSSSDRWNSNSAPGRGTSGLSASFSNNTNISLTGPSCPPPPGINNYVNERFEYKGNMGSGMRKY